MLRGKVCPLLLFAALFGGASLAQAETSDYGLEDGTLRFVCEGSKVTVPAWGEFGTVGAALSLNPDDLSKAKGHVEVLLVSISTEDAAWDTMFRRAGFLEIDEHPKSRFVIDQVHGGPLKSGNWVPLNLEGRFTLHGKTKKIHAPATAKWLAGTGKEKDAERIVVRADFHITWEEYDIAMPSGSTRLFAGDGAHIQVRLTYKPQKQKKKRSKR